MGYAGESSLPVIIWMGVVPGCLSAEDGLDVATHCKSLLFARDIDDVHVKIRESEVSAGPPVPRCTSPSSNATACAQGPFSTSVSPSAPKLPRPSRQRHLPPWQPWQDLPRQRQTRRLPNSNKLGCLMSFLQSRSSWSPWPKSSRNAESRGIGRTVLDCRSHIYVDSSRHCLIQIRQPSHRLV